MIEELCAALVEKTVDVGGGGVGLEPLFHPEVFLSFGEFLDLDIRRIPNHNIKACLTKHPLGVEVRRRGVLIVRIPVGKSLGAVATPAIGFEFGGDLFAELFIFFAVFVFLCVEFWR